MRRRRRDDALVPNELLTRASLPNVEGEKFGGGINGYGKLILSENSLPKEEPRMIKDPRQQVIDTRPRQAQKPRAGNYYYTVDDNELSSFFQGGRGCGESCSRTSILIGELDAIF